MAKMCQFGGCTNPVFSKGFCSWHTPRKPIEKSTKIGKRKKYSISPVSATRRNEYAIYREKRDEYFKTHQVCEFPGCRSRRITLHHKRGRIGKMLYDERYFCSLCGPHHTWVNEHNEEAAKMNLTESRLHE